MIKKIVLALLIVLLLPFSLMAEESSSGETNKVLVVKAVVAEDHGIEKPKDAVSLDRLVFEVELSTDSDALVEMNGEISISELADDGDFSIGLLYYGNQSTEYRGVINVFSSYAWAKSDESGNAIPLSVSLNIPSNLAEGIEVSETGVNELSFCVSPMGPRRGEKLASIDFAWDLGIDVLPGEYYSEINIGLTVV